MIEETKTTGRREIPQEIKAAGRGAEAQREGLSGVSQRNASQNQYKVSQQKSAVSAQYRESIAKEQESWLEQMGLEEETNGKKTEDEEKKDAIEDIEEMTKRLLSLETMFEKIRKMQEEARNKKNKKKKMNYNYRRVSAVIGGAKTSVQASLAISTAATNLSMVRRMAASGQYDKNDVNLALSHAQKMVRTARKKLTNIKYEVQQKKRNKSIENHKKYQVSQVHRPQRKYKMQRELERLQSQLKIQENQEKYRNRRTEDMELMMADMQYIRRKIELLKGETGNVNGSSAINIGVSTNSEEIMASAASMENLAMAETAMNAQAGAETAAVTSGGGEAVAVSAE